MAFEIYIETEAQNEIDEAIDWYESKQLGLGEEFLEYLDGYYETLKTEIPQFQIKRKPFLRELPLKRFPSVIIYRLMDKTIVVYSVFNTRQDPIKKGT